MSASENQIAALMAVSIFHPRPSGEALGNATPQPPSVWPKTQPATKQSPKAKEKAASHNQKELKVLKHQKNFKGGFSISILPLVSIFFPLLRLFLHHQISPLFLDFSVGFRQLGAVFNLI